MKILILKPSSLGDVIHALPVLRLLKAHLPQSQIYWWLDSRLKSLLEEDRDLAGVIAFDRRRWAAPHRWPEMLASLQHIRAKHFDWAIDLQGLARSGIFAWLADAGLTIGLDNTSEGSREGARAFYDLTPPRAAAGTHAVDRYLTVLPLLEVPVHWNFEWLPKRPEIAARIEEKWNAGAGPCIVLLPGARWDNKRWPVENFVELARLMRGMGAWRFVILGSGDERALGEAIAGANPGRCLNLAGQTSLWEMIEWVRRGRLVISNDTGPMHVAAALGRPLIALFGPSNPRHTGPYGKAGSVLQINSLPCIPCMQPNCHYAAPLACLTRITPLSVYAKVREALEAPATALKSAAAR
ncbi:MAG: lipopolysaccharide heptosyltransferase II [Verrucomicrobiota bacterium]